MQWLENSSFINHLGMRVESMDKDVARVSMPYRDELTTLADVVHGGAISSLIDTAAAAAAWSAAEGIETLRGTTVSLTVQFLAAARSADLIAEARVIRRGKNLCFVEIDVSDADGELAAKGVVTYKLG